LQIEIAEAGMSRTVDQIRSTVQTLVKSLPDPVIFYCLRDAGDPLAAPPVPPKERWWHKFAQDEEEQHDLPARLMQYKGTRKHRPVTKCLVIEGLERLLAETSDGGHVSPGADDDAYMPPPRGRGQRKKAVWATDPDKVDRGTTAHKATQDALADALRKVGLLPKRPRGNPRFDIAWRVPKDGPVGYVGEVKSLTDENEREQIRLAIGQVADYVHTLSDLRDKDSLPLRWKGVHDFKGVVAVEREPVAVHHWMSLCKEHGIILTWPKKYDETLADMLTDTR
jgi:hypothetical protein